MYHSERMVPSTINKSKYQRMFLNHTREPVHTLEAKAVADPSG